MPPEDLTQVFTPAVLPTYRIPLIFQLS